MRCAYCNERKQLTKEHVFPNFLYKTLDLKAENSSFSVYNTASGKEIKKEIFVRDVCDECNNVKLSKLDKHFSEIADNLLFREENEYSLQYDYNLLTRWLLKTIFNAIRFINADSRAEFIKKYYLKYILTGTTNNNLNMLVLGITIKDEKCSSDFMSIGTMVFPYEKSIRHISFFDFIQIKNFVFLILNFKSRKLLKKHSKKIIKFLNKEFNAVLFDSEKQFQVNYNSAKKLNRFIYHANEVGTSIPFKLLCKLDWNNDKNIDDIRKFFNNNHHTREEKILLDKYYQYNANKTGYSIDKNILVVTDIYSFILMDADIENEDKKFKLKIGTWDKSEINNVKILETAYGKIERSKEFTIINIYDRNEPKEPFIKNLRVPQIDERWNNLCNSIKECDGYIYIAYSNYGSVQKQLEQGSLANISFISKVKVIEIKHSVRN